jgi:hypothetical protein
LSKSIFAINEVDFGRSIKMSHDNFLKSIYELPSEYNGSFIKLMAKDPHCLFAYWEISAISIAQFYETFGQELWDKSVPALKITNISKNDYFFIQINDFSKSWYINVSDASCLYMAEIGRRINNAFFVSMAGSNPASTPCDNVSVYTNACFIDYRNLRTGKFNILETSVPRNTDFIIDQAVIYGISSAELP